MHGEFINKYRFGIVMFSCGLFLVEQFIFIRFVVSEWTNFVYSEILLFCIFAIQILPFLFYNYKAHINIDDNSISGRFGWSRKINCKIEDVAYCSAGMNTLSILLKNGKQIVIGNISNAYQLSEYLRERISFKELLSRDELTAKLQASMRKRKKDMIMMLLCLVILFANIFILVFLTGSREMSDFSQTDWFFTAVFGVLEMVVIVLMFIHADRAGKAKLSNEYITYCVKRVTVETQDLPSGNAKAVFTDHDYNGRLVIYYIPNQSSIYYVAQLFTEQLQLETTHTSGFFDNEESLDFDINEFTDITADVRSLF